MQSNRVLSIDPGFDRLGIAVLEADGSKQTLIYSECITTSTKDSHSQRLFAIGNGVKKVIEAYNPQTLAIETLFFNINAKSALGVAEARGVVIYEAERAGLKICEYSPQAIKIAVTGYGKADKIQVETMVRKLVSLSSKKDKTLDDELDAIAVGITHLATSKSI